MLVKWLKRAGLKICAVQILKTDRGYTRWVEAGRAVNMSTLGLDCMVTGGEFHRRIVLGKKEVVCY